MGVSKVEINNADGTKNVLVDLTGDTVTADMLAKGVTAHGADGELITGAMQAGIDTSDADATADDIVSPKTAYVNGEKVEGTLVAKAINITVGSAYATVDSENKLNFSLGNASSYGKRRLIDKGQEITLKYSLEKLGDATAEDVAKGKTFTSVAGLKVTGTAEPMVSNDNCEAYQITSASTALNFKRTDGSIKVWGYGYKSSGTYQKTVYAFCGDGYYTGSSWGTPSKTSATFRLNSNGTLSGLPDGLTALDVLVTKGI